MNYVRVAASSDVVLNQIKAVQAGGKELVLARTARGLAALDRKCKHIGPDLCIGSLDRQGPDPVHDDVDQAADIT